MNKNTPYILYLGGIFSEETMLVCPAVSPAANRWQSGLVRALIDLQNDVRVLGHIPEPLWPRGRQLMHDNASALSPEFSGDLVDYWNMPFIRSSSLKFSYKRAFERICGRKGLPACIISYNAYPHCEALALYAQRRFAIPWLCIVADAPDPGPRRERHDRIVNQAAGRVFLSWGCFSACAALPSLHLDGGIEEIRFSPDTGPPPCQKPAVLYTGVMNQYGGVSLLLEAFKLVKNKNAELWLCGKGGDEDITHAAAEDTRIKWFGMVTEERLQELSAETSIFINPRPSALPASAGNFPSKILEYLSYGKPVISTWTEGLCPDYKKVLEVPEEETAAGLARTIDEVLQWDGMARHAIAGQIYEFMASEKLWSIQAKRLADWLRDEVLPLKKGSH